MPIFMPTMMSVIERSIFSVAPDSTSLPLASWRYLGHKRKRRCLHLCQEPGQSRRVRRLLTDGYLTTPKQPPLNLLRRTYSRYIGDHADALARRALLDMSATDNMDELISAAILPSLPACGTFRWTRAVKQGDAAIQQNSRLAVQTASPPQIK
jgi:hypothetical protein